MIALKKACAKKAALKHVNLNSSNFWVLPSFTFYYIAINDQYDGQYFSYWCNKIHLFRLVMLF
jgi:hypothetical protein